MIDFVKKHIANFLTLLRLVMTPIFIALFLSGQYINALIIFVLAAITDFFDGRLARKYNITDFGKIQQQKKQGTKLYYRTTCPEILV